LKGSQLVDMGLEEACDAKWRAGRARYGPAWAGERPVLEALAEAVDLVIYLREDMKLPDSRITETDLGLAEWFVRTLQDRCRAREAA
jgi:hypothetical protein